MLLNGRGSPPAPVACTDRACSTSGVLGDRSQFEDLTGIAYLNHAAMSPPSRAVRDACRAMLDDYPRHGAAAWIRQSESR